MRESDRVLTNAWEDLDATTLKAMREKKSYGSIYTSLHGWAVDQTGCTTDFEELAIGLARRANG